LEKSQGEIIFLENRDISTEADPIILKEKIIELENQNRQSFNEFIIAMILDEMDIKTNLSEIAQEYPMMSSLLYMQLHHNESEISLEFTF
jgi:hypothetical protein